MMCAGELSAAINAATLALVDAGIAMQDLVVACNAGYLDTTPLLGTSSNAECHTWALRSLQCLRCVDLNYLEKNGGGPQLPVALLPKTNKVTLVQMDSRLPLEVYEVQAGMGVASMPPAAL